MPDTLNYLILGYSLAFAIIAFTLGSIYWRYRSILADRATLEQLESDSPTTSNPPTSETVRA